MEWTVERITELCVEYCGRCDVEFNSPVSINGRLTSTLGRCFYEKFYGVWTPTKIEISRKLLETATEECIKAVIAHECAHYVACAVTAEDHGHDETFRFYCRMIGTDNDGSIYRNLTRTCDNDSVYKYTLYCKKCGKFVGGRSRACKVTKQPYNFYSNCCHANIRVQQNW